MKHIDELARKVIEISTDRSRDPESRDEAIKLLIKQYASDALNLFENISETSLDEKDKDQRIQSLLNKSGLSRVYNKFY